MVGPLPDALWESLQRAPNCRGGPVSILLCEKNYLVFGEIIRCISRFIHATVSSYLFRASESCSAGDAYLDSVFFIIRFKRGCHFSQSRAEC
jgi:hypothetical protein